MLRTDLPPEGYRRNVGIMLLNRAGEVFVGQRLDMAEEAWQMPQGGIDPGETPIVAALRELLEEVGTNKGQVLAESRGWLTYDLPEELRQRLWRGKWRGQTQKWFALRFTGQDSDINIATAHPEFSAWKWTPVDTVVDLIVPFKRPLYEEVVAEFRPFAVPA